MPNPPDTILEPLDIALLASACRSAAICHGRISDGSPLNEQATVTYDRLAQLLSGAAAVFVVAKNCDGGHNMTQPEGPGRFYACSRCGARTHIRACIDPEEGTVTCVCGFDRAEEAYE